MPVKGKSDCVSDPAASFRTRLLPLSERYTLPPGSNAMPNGLFRPANGNTACGPYAGRGVAVALAVRVVVGGRVDGVYSPGPRSGIAVTTTTAAMTAARTM